MIVSQFDNITISGLAVAVPSNWVSIESFKDDENREVTHHMNVR